MNTTTRLRPEMFERVEIVVNELVIVGEPMSRRAGGGHLWEYQGRPLCYAPQDVQAAAYPAIRAWQAEHDGDPDKAAPTMPPGEDFPELF